MDKILGFVPRLLGLVGSGLAAAQGGLSILSDAADGNPKKSGIFAIFLGWVGIDPTILGSAGKLFETVGGWLQAL